MKLLALVAALVAPLTSIAFRIQPGAKVPPTEFHFGFPPQKILAPAYTAGKNMLIVGIPAAFTPTSSRVQVPGYLLNQQALKETGIVEVLILCVNDGAVMRAWNKKLLEEYPVQENMVTFMGDPAGDFARACGMLMDAQDPEEAGFLGRSRRYALHVVNNIVRYVAVSEAENDLAGDEDPSATCHEAMITAILKQEA
jgi:2-Cys peroxiredoxin 5